MGVPLEKPTFQKVETASSPGPGAAAWLLHCDLGKSLSLRGQGDVVEGKHKGKRGLPFLSLSSFRAYQVENVLGRGQESRVGIYQVPAVGPWTVH